MTAKRFLISIFACFLALSLIYEAVAEEGLLDRYIFMDSQWETNRAWAEGYIYRAPNKQVVMVGSSLSQRIGNQVLPPNMINIAMAGQGSLDGLAIIDRIHSHPKMVLIETNVLERGESDSFIDGLFGPPWYEARRHWKSFREIYRPMGIFSGVVYASSKNLKQELAFSTAQPNASDGRSNGVRSEAIVPRKTVHGSSGKGDAEASIRKSLERHQEHYATPPNQRQFAARMRQLEKYVHSLEAGGTQVVFFEMPTHPTLCASAYLTFVRSQVREHFPSHQYIRDRNCARYQVTDGLHLAPASAIRFALGMFHILKQRVGYGGRDHHAARAAPLSGHHAHI